MKRRLVGGGIGAVIALPWLALQLFGFVDAVDPHALSGGALPGLMVANLALLCVFVAVASDFLSTSVRAWRAALIGIGVAFLVPGPFMVDFFVVEGRGGGVAYWIQVLVPNLVLLMLFGGSAAGIYLLATRKRTHE
ncbi:MAG: hypothetical protein E6I72_01595 [Chloroflexi bacterium]|nr:MAG: hypothetical protein E6I72_01595 [Chloroflexota bacterium]